MNDYNMRYGIPQNSDFLPPTTDRDFRAPFPPVFEQLPAIDGAFDGRGRAGRPTGGNGSGGGGFDGVMTRSSRRKSAAKEDSVGSFSSEATFEPPTFSIPQPLESTVEIARDPAEKPTTLEQEGFTSTQNT